MLLFFSAKRALNISQVPAVFLCVFGSACEKHGSPQSVEKKQFKRWDVFLWGRSSRAEFKSRVLRKRDTPEPHPRCALTSSETPELSAHGE